MNIVLGITGSIAAYKAAEITRLLVTKGHTVKVIMTDHAKQFIHPNTLATLSQHPVYHDLFDPTQPPMAHIDLAKWADLMLIAPATAAFLAKLAIGLADDLLSTTCLATTAKTIIAPAMNKHMWAHPAVKNNIAQLKKHNILLLNPEMGAQACGDYGEGRLLDPDTLVHIITQQSSSSLQGTSILITAGPTLEPIDPVRFISNYSSGKMGYALAETAFELGAQVTLISGPTALDRPKVHQFIPITTSDDMHQAVINHISHVDIFISCAAVADYKPKTTSFHKIKKSTSHLSLDLVKTIDILSDVSTLKKKPYLVGFALESTALLENAHKKLIQKGLNIIVANQIATDNIPFNSDENEVILISKKSGTIPIPRTSKKEIAKKILELIIQEIIVPN